MAQEIHGRVAKGALGEVEDQASQPESVEDLLEMGFVLLAGLVGHKDVINVDEDKAQAIEDLVHEPFGRSSRHS